MQFIDFHTESEKLFVENGLFALCLTARGCGSLLLPSIMRALCVLLAQKKIKIQFLHFAFTSL